MRCACHNVHPPRYGLPPSCTCALTYSPPRCAGWAPAAAPCCGQPGVGGGGGGAAGGVPRRGQGEGQSARGTASHPPRRGLPHIPHAMPGRPSCRAVTHVRSRDQSLAAALRRTESCRCTLAKRTRRQRRCWRHCGRLTRILSPRWRHGSLTARCYLSSTRTRQSRSRHG